MSFYPDVCTYVCIYEYMVSHTSIWSKMKGSTYCTSIHHQYMLFCAGLRYAVIIKIIKYPHICFLFPLRREKSPKFRTILLVRAPSLADTVHTVHHIWYEKKNSEIKAVSGILHTTTVAAYRPARSPVVSQRAAPADHEVGPAVTLFDDRAASESLLLLSTAHSQQAAGQ